MKRKIVDDDNIEYEEVSYEKYLQSKNKHRIVQSLEHRYFVEIDRNKIICDKCGQEIKEEEK